MDGSPFAASSRCSAVNGVMSKPDFDKRREVPEAAARTNTLTHNQGEALVVARAKAIAVNCNETTFTPTSPHLG